MRGVPVARIGLAALSIGLLALSARGAGAATPSSVCPGQMAIVPTGNAIPAPGGMPGNCTVAFYDGTVNFVGGATGFVSDPFVGTTTIYDDRGRVVGETNSLGETVVLGLAPGRLSTVTDPLGHVTTFAYDADGSVTHADDPLGHLTSYTYDASDRAVGVTDPLGRPTTYAYDAQGLMESSVDVYGNTTTYTYDAAGQLTDQMDTLGNMTSYAYDSSGRLTKRSDNLGDTTMYGYDTMGRVISETDTAPSGTLTTTYAYNAGGDLVTVDTAGRMTTYLYDARDRVAEVTDTTGGATTYAYDAAGDVVSETDAAGNVTRFAYDARGDLTSMIDPIAGDVTFAYAAVPEPSTWAMLLIGLGAIGFAPRLRKALLAA